MFDASVRPVIRLRGVRHNNLKNFDLDLPLGQLIVLTGLSGSGKSSLAFDTLFAEGQRRYIETFSPYARQFFDRMDKPQVDSIEGIPPAIAIEQRNAIKTTRSTVGTMTEICDYMKLVWPHLAQLHCRQCGQPVRKDSPARVWEVVKSEVRSPRSEPRKLLGEVRRPEAEGDNSHNLQPASHNGEFLITFDLPLSEKMPLEECLALVAKQGYQRLLLDGQIVRLDELADGNATVQVPLKARPCRSADASSACSVGSESRGRGVRAPMRPAQSPGKKLPGQRLASLTVIQDRLSLDDANRARFVEACEQAYHFGKGNLAIRELGSAASIVPPRLFSNRLHCARCDIEYREPSPALFSFNHPVGACPACKGFGRVISIDYDLALPDRSRTLAQGVVKPWQTGLGAECQADLLRMCRQHGAPTDVPFAKLRKKWQDFVIEGEPGYGKDEAHEWPRAWYGVKGYFRWLESKAYKMHVRVLLSRYRAYTPCPSCQGKRFQPEALLYRIGSPKSKTPSEAPGEKRNGMTLADFYQLSIRDALKFIETVAAGHRFRPNDPLGITLNEVRSRLGYLHEVGLGYLALDRPTRSLSGGETERVNLTTCLGTRLVNTLFVLDEPSVGLHPRDTERLVRILLQLRRAGNTVVVVEHEASVMRAADQIVDLGPGHGATGGRIVFQGTFPAILKSRESLTGQYLSGRKQIEIPRRRPVKRSRPPRSRRAARAAHSRVSGPALRLAHATRHNLQDLSVEIPLGRLVCITGVSGSGKTTLVREVLLPTLESKFKDRTEESKASERFDTDGEAGGEEQSGSGPEASRSAVLEGAEQLARVVLVDQSILGKTPRSNPAVYIGAFEDIREFFAQSEPAKQRGLNASAFSFNSAQGQCERCRGAGFEKIEMQFLSDVFIRCPDCNGRRYRDHILGVRVSPQSTVRSSQFTVHGSQSSARPVQPVMLHAPRTTHHAPRSSPSLSIADLLESTVEEAIEFLAGFPESRPAARAVASLNWLREVGLGYLKVGQPINTLSGGESQRLKLVKHLAEAMAGTGIERARTAGAGDPDCKLHQSNPAGRVSSHGALPGEPTLFLFDEPTTGLHFDDVRVLLGVFQRLVDAGHSVVVIEHNLDVIKSADWLIDLGPDAGDEGGQVIAEGTPEAVAGIATSHTGRALREAAFRVTPTHAG